VFLAEYFYLLVLALGVVLLVLRYRDRLAELALAAAIIGGISYILSKLGNSLVSSPRPFIVSGQAPLIPSATDNGFPSDHTMLLSALAAIIGLVSIRWFMLFGAMTLVVGIARVSAGVHHYIDIAGSVLIVVLATAIYLLARHLWKRRGQTFLNTKK
jgi:membrane-associated phospholipid phosphatase